MSLDLVHIVVWVVYGPSVVLGIVALIAFFCRRRWSRILGLISIGGVVFAIATWYFVLGGAFDVGRILFFFVNLIPGAVAVAFNRLPRAPSGICKTCGYNLTGNVSGKCSECGAPVPAP